MGDFNAVLDVVLDSFNPNRSSSSDLIGWASVAGLSELQRWKHPADRCFSHISTAHRSSARIDLSFGNSLILPFMTDIEYLAGRLSDHNPLSLTLSFSTGAKRGVDGSQPARCTMNRSLPSWRNQSSHIGPLMLIWQIPPVVWDAFKAVARGGMYICH